MTGISLSQIGTPSSMGGTEAMWAPNLQMNTPQQLNTRQPRTSAQTDPNATKPPQTSQPQGLDPDPYNYVLSGYTQPPQPQPPPQQTQQLLQQQQQEFSHRTQQNFAQQHLEQMSQQQAMGQYPTIADDSGVFHSVNSSVLTAGSSSFVPASSLTAGAVRSSFVTAGSSFVPPSVITGHSRVPHRIIDGHNVTHSDPAGNPYIERITPINPPINLVKKENRPTHEETETEMILDEDTGFVVKKNVIDPPEEKFVTVHISESGEREVVVVISESEEGEEEEEK